jgi:hypothetical protein
VPDPSRFLGRVRAVNRLCDCTEIVSARRIDNVGVSAILSAPSLDSSFLPALFFSVLSQTGSTFSNPSFHHQPRKTPTLPTHREGSGTHPNPWETLNPEHTLYCAGNICGVIIPQSSMDSSNGKYADGKRVGHPPLVSSKSLTDLASSGLDVASTGLGMATGPACKQ